MLSLNGFVFLFLVEFRLKINECFMFMMLLLLLLLFAVYLSCSHLLYSSFVCLLWIIFENTKSLVVWCLLFLFFFRYFHFVLVLVLLQRENVIYSARSCLYAPFLFILFVFVVDILWVGDYFCLCLLLIYEIGCNSLVCVCVTLSQCKL